MHAAYPARYLDAHGSINTVIENDGTTLSMRLGSVVFQCNDFDGFQLPEGIDGEALQPFTLNRRDLCNCQILCDIPIEIVWRHAYCASILNVNLTLGRPAANGGLDSEILILTIPFLGHSYQSAPTDLFEPALLDLHRKFATAFPATPAHPSPYLKSCFTCAYSDYSPYGQGLFGHLYCFRARKEAYCAAQTKEELLAIWDKGIPPVQEIDWCEEYRRRPPNTGYRG